MAAKRSIMPLEAIEFICKNTMDNDFDGVIEDDIKKDINVIANLLDISPRQALFVSVACTLNFNDTEALISDFASFFKCTPVRILMFIEDLNELIEKGVFVKEEKRRGKQLSITTRRYVISEPTSTALLNNTKIDFSNTNIKKHETLCDLLYGAYSIIELYEDSDRKHKTLYDELYQLSELNTQFSIIKYLMDNEIGCGDLAIFYKVAWSSLKIGVELDVEKAVCFLHSRASESTHLVYKIIEGDINLISHDLIEVNSSGMSDDATIILTEKARCFMQADGLKISKSSVKIQNIVDITAFSNKELFYNPEDVLQMETLSRILEDKQFTALQERLKETGMSDGLPILLYGGPGTGKTESVYQFAKKSGRKLMKVDMSENKSMWYGKSEKIVKQIFTKYYEFAASCEVMPILFLNEADALLGNRNNYSRGSIDKTEHTMQNILLDEIENFKGIMFATTNLSTSLDKAFDRRFLYKIELNNPKPEVSAKIWQSKLSTLSSDECLDLAKSFNFSGGQIDNIARKCTVMELLNNITPSFEEVKNICKEELLAKSKMSAIGFQSTKL